MDKTLAQLKAISDKNRLRIVSVLLVHEELCACQITEFLKVAGATASRHLNQMVNSGLLQNRKQGRWIYFRLNREDASLTAFFQWVNLKVKTSTQAEADMDALKQILFIPCEELSRKQRKGSDCAKS